MDLLRHLDFFVAIAEETHFGRAAQRLNMTQPPLSQGLQRLEADLGVRLVNRGARGVELTQAGDDLLPRARRLLEDASRLRATAGEHARQQDGVRLGVTGQLSARQTAAVAATCRSAVPGGTVTLQTAPTLTLVDAVSTGRLDVAVIHHPAVIGDLTGGDVVRLSTVLLLPAGDAIGAGRRSLRDVVRRPLLAAPRAHNPAAYDLLAETLAINGVQTGVAPADDERTALALVAAGQAGLTTADPVLIAPGVQRVPVPGDALPLRLRVVASPRPAPHLPESLVDDVTSALRGSPAVGGVSR
jgi:DNA-binding transcriptional LysR family regulator